MIIILNAKSHLQNPIPIQDRSPTEITDAEDISQNNKGISEQAHRQHRFKWRESKSNFIEISYSTIVHSLHTHST